MVSVQSPPGGRELPYARVLLPPAILMAAVTGAAVALVTGPARAAVGWCGGVATLLVIAVAAEAVRRGRVIRAVRAELARRTAYLEQRIAAHDQDIVRFHHEVLPAAIRRMNRGMNPDSVAHRFGVDDPSLPQISEVERDLLGTVLQLLDTEKLLLDSSHRSFVNIARRVQAIVHQQNKELREMEEDHGRNPEVFDDLLRIDHGTALIGRLADSIAVLGGGRPGRNWPKPVPLFSVMRGAMSRILEYRRIELHSIADVNVNGIHVEPVIHAVAELLDNATRYSPPNSKVHLTALKVQTGVAIEIEDSGVSFSDEARGKMEELLRQAAAGTDLQVLGEAPRLGISVVGRLSKMYDMAIALRQSAYGGVRAVVVVPSNMLTKDPAASLAHGIGANSTATMDTDGVEGPNRKPKKRRPTTGPRLPEQDDGARDDDAPWSPNGRPTACRSGAAGSRSRSGSGTPRPPGSPPRKRRPPPRLPPGALCPPPRRSRRRRRKRRSHRGTGSRRSGRASSVTRTPTRSPGRTRRPRRPTTRGTSSDPSAGQLRLDAQGSR